MTMMLEEEKEVLEGTREILGRPPNGYRNLISILQTIQDRFGYLPRQGMTMVADHLGLSPANVFGVATFYNQFRFSPPGKCHVRVCMGTACHIKRGELILDQWKRRLEIDEGGRTEDGEYSIERVACVGACAMAPVSIVADEVVGHMAPTKVDGILLQHKIKKEQEAKQQAKAREDESSSGEGS
jgi:NADH-quinone oxidoreductase subunit E